MPIAEIHGEQVLSWEGYTDNVEIRYSDERVIARQMPFSREMECTVRSRSEIGMPGETVYFDGAVWGTKVPSNIVGEGFVREYCAHEISYGEDAMYETVIVVNKIRRLSDTFITGKVIHLKSRSRGWFNNA